MRRRPPPEVDPERLRSLLASARPRPEPVGPSGWVPEEVLHGGSSFDPGWLDEPSADDGVHSAQAEVGAKEAGAGGRHRPPPRVVTVPVALRGARVAVSVRAVVAFLLLLVAAVGFFAIRVARAEQAAAPQSVPTGEGLVGRSSVPVAFTSGTRSATASEAAGASAVGSPGRLVVVDVVGQVAQPGVVRVADGSRVVDVLAVAGGTLPGADVQRLNLARVVVDGEQVFVPRPGETPPVPVGVAGGAGVGGGSGSTAASGSGAGAASGAVGSGASGAGAPVDLNAANLAVLDTLPGVGPVLAQRILDWRAQYGRFSSVDELGEVSGIGDKLLEQIRPKVRV